MKQSNRNSCVNFSGICLLMIFLCTVNNFAQNQVKIVEKKISPKNSATFNQNKSRLGKYKIRQVIFPYKIGETIVKIVVSKTSSASSKFVYFNMHDNENTAVEAAKDIIGRFGGTLVEMQHGGERLVKLSLKENQFTFDPNRIFTAVGIEKTLKSDTSQTNEMTGEAKKFAENLEKYLKAAKLIIAVHNNTDGNYSIESYTPGGEFENDAKLANINSKSDIDDFFFVTENGFYKTLKAKNQNVVLQDNEKVTDDGSLAVYCARKKISYVNVESEHGHLTEQTKMLEILQDLIKNFIRPKNKKPRKRFGAIERKGWTFK